MDLASIALLILVIVLTALIFYLSCAIVGQDWSVSGSLALRILPVSLIAVFIIPALRDVAGQLSVSDLGLLFAFVLLIIVVRYVLVEELTVSDEWLAAIIVSLIAVVLIYVVDHASRSLFHVGLFNGL